MLQSQPLGLAGVVGLDVALAVGNLLLTHRLLAHRKIVVELLLLARRQPGPAAKVSKINLGPEGR
jgi:hypothetical protein